MFFSQLNKLLTQKKGHITLLIRAILGPAAHHALRLRGLPRSSDLAKTGGRICLKDDFHRGSESNLITFPRKPHYKTLSTAESAKLKDCHGPVKRDSVMNWSNRVYDTALGGNPCCTFAFYLATFSLPRCRRKLRHTRQLPPGGRARPEASFRINHSR